MPGRSLRLFLEKPAVFLDAAAISLDSLSALKSYQQRDLAVFMSAELLNALIQIRDQLAEAIDCYPPTPRALLPSPIHSWILCAPAFIKAYRTC